MTKPSRSGATRRPGRPRQAEVDRRLESAVLSLLQRSGPTAITVEAVALESAVAKTTIYRRYANRADLLSTVLRNAIGTPGSAPAGTVRDKIRFALEETWRQMTDILGPGGLAAILADTDPEFTELFRAALRPFDDALVAQIRDDSEAGQLKSDVDADGVVSLFIGAYLGGLLRRGHIDQEWMDRCIDLMWSILAPPPD